MINITSHIHCSSCTVIQVRHTGGKLLNANFNYQSNVWLVNLLRGKVQFEEPIVVN